MFITIMKGEREGCGEKEWVTLYFNCGYFFFLIKLLANICMYSIHTRILFTGEQDIK
uniref:Uncharacterized protein n=1 Tax=Octopus bimaculoides TaxID=37653 RepID=A0A0L8GD49_OCTBM